MIITVIIDTSGSMGVMAKNHIVSALVNYCVNIPEIDKKKYARVNFRFITMAGEEIRDTGNTGIYFKKGEKPGLASLDKIFKTAKPGDMNFIFLSDGIFPPDEVKKYQQITEDYPGLRLLAAAVGADAHEYTLKKIAYGGRIFHPEDIPYAVDFFLSAQGKCPVSIASMEGVHG